jgi:hypothetical protein
MIEFLVTKGADVNIRTTGEEQTPIHFAAKNDACKSLKALIAYGVDVSCRDYQERTPLQVAHCLCFRFTLYLNLVTFGTLPSVTFGTLSLWKMNLIFSSLNMWNGKFKRLIQKLINNS